MSDMIGRRHTGRIYGSFWNTQAMNMNQTLMGRFIQTVLLYSKENLDKLRTNSITFSLVKRLKMKFHTHKHTHTHSYRKTDKAIRVLILVLPLVRAAPFEPLDQWCPSFLLLGFTIGKSWRATPLLSNAGWKRGWLFVIFFFLSFFSLTLSHPPAGFSQMEVAKHSRPALHNLRMKEGGSASHHTR